MVVTTLQAINHKAYRSQRSVTKVFDVWGSSGDCLYMVYVWFMYGLWNMMIWHDKHYDNIWVFLTFEKWVLSLGLHDMIQPSKVRG